MIQWRIVFAPQTCCRAIDVKSTPQSLHSNSLLVTVTEDYTVRPFSRPCNTRKTSLSSVRRIWKRTFTNWPSVEIIVTLVRFCPNDPAFNIGNDLPTLLVDAKRNFLSGGEEFAATSNPNLKLLVLSRRRARGKFRHQILVVDRRHVVKNCRFDFVRGDGKFDLIRFVVGRIGRLASFFSWTTATTSSTDSIPSVACRCTPPPRRRGEVPSSLLLVRGLLFLGLQ